MRAGLHLRVLFVAAFTSCLAGSASGCAAADGPGDGPSEESDQALLARAGEIDEDATPLGAAELEAASLEADEEPSTPSDLDADEDTSLAAPLGPPPAQGAREVLDPSCAASTSLQLLVYYEVSIDPLLDALKAAANPCARYWINIPKLAPAVSKPRNALEPRALTGSLGHLSSGRRVAELGPAFRATAEVHWSGSTDDAGHFFPGWKNVGVTKTGPSTFTVHEVPKSEYLKTDFYSKGVLFRQKMAKANYRPQDGDTWHINELESSWERTRAYQHAIREMVRGLSDGDPTYDVRKDPDLEKVSPGFAKKSAADQAAIADAINMAARRSGVKGIILVSSNGKRRKGETTDDVWRGKLAETLRHVRFWEDMASYVETWGQERYIHHGTACAANTVLAQSDAMGALLENFPLLAESMPRYGNGKSTVPTAIAYLSRHYTPVLNAARFLDETVLTTEQMEAFVSGEIRATRAFSNDHAFSDGRIGVYYRTYKTKNALYQEDEAVAVRTALALNAAYDGKTGPADAACGALRAACLCTAR